MFTVIYRMEHIIKPLRGSASNLGLITFLHPQYHECMLCLLGYIEQTLFVCLFVFETGFLCIALVVLELTL